jgi:hypothetical protein
VVKNPLILFILKMQPRGAEVVEFLRGLDVNSKNKTYQIK